MTDEIYRLSEPQSVQHLFKVACGLDSMVLGETEILGQLKKAYDLALQNGHTGGRLNKAFQRAFNVAKHIRTETNIQRGSVSVGSVAVELAEKIFSRLSDRDVLVIGAGDTSEKTARALLSRGARSILVTNRSHDKAVALAAELGGRAVPFEDWAAEFANIDIVISSTSAPHYILDRARLEPLMKLRRNRPLLLIDIAVPRDIEPEVNFLEERVSLQHRRPQADRRRLSQAAPGRSRPLRADHPREGRALLDHPAPPEAGSVARPTLIPARAHGSHFGTQVDDARPHEPMQLINLVTPDRLMTPTKHDCHRHPRQRPGARPGQRGPGPVPRRVPGTELRA